MKSIEMIILEADKPTVNGRVYSVETCEKIVETINNGGVPVVETDDFSINDMGFNIEMAKGVCESAKLEDGKVIVTFRLPENTKYAWYTPSGIGSVDEKLNISDYELKFIQLNPRENDD